MEKIKFVRVYRSYGNYWYDVIYKSGKICTYCDPVIPKTVSRFIALSKFMKTQYDKVFKRIEIIYE